MIKKENKKISNDLAEEILDFIASSELIEGFKNFRKFEEEFKENFC